MSDDRSVYLLLSDLTILEAWSDELRETFPDLFGVYLVGSSLTTTAHRDVDVRCVMYDDDHATLAETIDLDRLHLALSLWGQKVTGLPIDCQTQTLTESGAETGPIRPLNRRKAGDEGTSHCALAESRPAPPSGDGRATDA